MPPNKGGVARYLAGLLGGLSEEGRTIAVLVKGEDVGWLREQAPDHHYVVGPSWLSRRPLRLFWEQIGLPLAARRLGVSTLHSPHYTFPLISARRTVVTVHDATFFSAPADHGRLKRAFFRGWIRLGRRFAATTVVPSRSTADELERHAGRARGDVRVALHGVDPEVFHTPTDHERRAFAHSHDLDPATDWIAFLGTIEPRKNVTALIAAHRALLDDDPATPPLIVAGGLGWDDEAATILRAAGDAPGAPLRYVGYLALDELSAFLGGAAVVAYPSRAEGFGLPVLEAMSTGALVVTTNVSALPEVGGDAVLYTDATVPGITATLRSALDDSDGGRRLRLLAAERARLFTWSACADIHEAAYREVSARVMDPAHPSGPERA